MKRTHRLFTLILALILSVGTVIVPAAAAEDLMYGIGFVNASSLRLRSEPDTNASTIATAPQDDCVVVISKRGQWYKVK